MNYYNIPAIGIALLSKKCLWAIIPNYYPGYISEKLGITLLKN